MTCLTSWLTLCHVTRFRSSPQGSRSAISLQHACHVSSVGQVFCFVFFLLLPSPSHLLLSLVSCPPLISSITQSFHSHCVYCLLPNPHPHTTPTPTTIHLTPCRKKATLFSHPSRFSCWSSSLRTSSSRDKGKWHLPLLKRRTTNSHRPSPRKPFWRALTRPRWRPCTNCCSCSIFSSSSVLPQHSHTAQSPQYVANNAVDVSVAANLLVLVEGVHVMSIISFFARTGRSPWASIEQARSFCTIYTSLSPFFLCNKYYTKQSFIAHGAMQVITSFCSDVIVTCTNTRVSACDSELIARARAVAVEDILCVFRTVCVCVIVPWVCKKVLL